MDLTDCRDFILTLPHVEECEPFDDDIVVYKLCGKWFAVVIFSRGGQLAVKCNPDRAILLRDEYPAIAPAWHFNKRHWNDLHVSSLPPEIVRREIRHSYFTVLRNNVTPKSLRCSILAELSALGITDDAPLPL